MTRDRDRPVPSATANARAAPHAEDSPGESSRNTGGRWVHPFRISRATLSGTRTTPQPLTFPERTRPFEMGISRPHSRYQTTPASASTHATQLRSVGDSSTTTQRPQGRETVSRKNAKDGGGPVRARPRRTHSPGVMSGCSATALARWTQGHVGVLIERQTWGRSANP
jgi:hypothetical protein